MRSRPAFVACLAALLCATACGAPTDPAANAPEPITADAFRRQLESDPAVALAADVATRIAGEVAGGRRQLPARSGDPLSSLSDEERARLLDMAARTHRPR